MYNGCIEGVSSTQCVYELLRREGGRDMELEEVVIIDNRESLPSLFMHVIPLHQRPLLRLLSHPMHTPPLPCRRDIRYTRSYKIIIVQSKLYAGYRILVDRFYVSTQQLRSKKYLPCTQVLVMPRMHNSASEPEHMTQQNFLLSSNLQVSNYC